MIISSVFGQFDIREKGSGNAGASNITNVMGWKFGATVALIDILKAFIPMTLARCFFHVDFTIMFVIGFGVILGHIFPLPHGFRGGKGLASLIGMCYALDWKLGLLMNLTLIVITLITDYIFIGALTLYVLLPIILMFTNKDILTIILGFILMFIGFFKHRSNMNSLKKGEEVGLKSVLKKHKS